MVAWITNTTKLKKIATTTSSLANTQPKKLLHCWKCREVDHTKKDPNCLYFSKKIQPPKKSKKKEEVANAEVKVIKESIQVQPLW